MKQLVNIILLLFIFYNLLIKLFSKKQPKNNYIITFLDLTLWLNKLGRANMSCKVEKIGTNKANLTIEVDNVTLKKLEDKVFNKEKGKLSASGFRKGKVTKEMAFKVYGRNAFLED